MVITAISDRQGKHMQNVKNHTHGKQGNGSEGKVGGSLQFVGR